MSLYAHRKAIAYVVLTVVTIVAVQVGLNRADSHSAQQLYKSNLNSCKRGNALRRDLNVNITLAAKTGTKLVLLKRVDCDKVVIKP